jgi:L-threonylcarbamoyladenylate synthase
MTETLKVDPGDEQAFKHAVEKTRRILDAGGVIAFPTDTFYGLGADPENDKALARIFKAKGRPEAKPLLVLVASPDQVPGLTQPPLPDAAGKLMRTLWPGPLTLVMRARKTLPERLTAGRGTLGIRQPGSAFALRLLALLARPMTATSANPSGGKNALSARDASRLPGVDLVLDGGDAPGGLESTVLDVTVSPPVLLREGAVARESIEEALGTRVAAGENEGRGR